MFFKDDPFSDFLKKYKILSSQEKVNKLIQILESEFSNLADEQIGKHHHKINVNNLTVEYKDLK